MATSRSSSTSSPAPFVRRSARSRARRSPSSSSDGSELGLQRVLETVTDGVEVEERDGGAWVALTKATGRC